MASGPFFPDLPTRNPARMPEVPTDAGAPPNPATQSHAPPGPFSLQSIAGPHVAGSPVGIAAQGAADATLNYPTANADAIKGMYNQAVNEGSFFGTLQEFIKLISNQFNMPGSPAAIGGPVAVGAARGIAGSGMATRNAREMLGRVPGIVDDAALVASKARGEAAGGAMDQYNVGNPLMDTAAASAQVQGMREGLDSIPFTSSGRIKAPTTLRDVGNDALLGSATGAGFEGLRQMNSEQPVDVGQIMGAAGLGAASAPAAAVMMRNLSARKPISSDQMSFTKGGVGDAGTIYTPQASHVTAPSRTNVGAARAQLDEVDGQLGRASNDLRGLRELHGGRMGVQGAPLPGSGGGSLPGSGGSSLPPGRPPPGKGNDTIYGNDETARSSLPSPTQKLSPPPKTPQHGFGTGQSTSNPDHRKAMMESRVRSYDMERTIFQDDAAAKSFFDGIKTRAQLRAHLMEMMRVDKLPPRMTSRIVEKAKAKGMWKGK